MYSSDIRKLIVSDPITNSQFGGVYARDNLPQVVKHKPSIYVINSDVSSSTGKHWLCVYFPASGNMNEFFDSYGKHPSIYGESIMHFLERNGKQFRFNTKLLQGQFSAVCGHYTIFYAYYRCRGRSMRDIVKESFTLDKKLNDVIVYNFIRTHFNS